MLLPRLRGRIKEGASKRRGGGPFQIMSHDPFPEEPGVQPSPSRPPPKTGDMGRAPLLRPSSYARSLNRWILPVAVLGSSGTYSTQRGYL
jgi:hypothetical protein